MDFVNGELAINEAEVLDIFKSALIKLYNNDRFLIGQDAHEQTIATRFAMYLREDLFFAEENGLRVDVEYNRNGVNGDEKRTESGSLIRADIILHERGIDINNIIYCEIKKNSINNKDDINKIKGQIKQRKYKFGIYISLIRIDEAQFNTYILRDKKIITRSYKFNRQTQNLEGKTNRYI